MFSRTPLDWLNFFHADVRGGLGAYVGGFLLTQANWIKLRLGPFLRRAAFSVSRSIHPKGR